MGMASGRVTYILVQMWENGVPKAPEFFFALPKGEFFLPHVSCLEMLRLW